MAGQSKKLKNITIPPRGEKLKNDLTNITCSSNTVEGEGQVQMSSGVAGGQNLILRNP